MGDARRKSVDKERLYQSLEEEINKAVKRFQERRGENPTRLFLGKVEAAVMGMRLGFKDPHGKKICLSGSGIVLPIWSMKSARTMVDVG